MTDNKTNQCYQILILYEQKLISALSAASSIGVTERQFFRIAKRFQDSGRNIEALKFQSHPAWNKTNSKIEQKILELNQDSPEALNSHLSWLAWDLHGLKINPQTIRNILIRHNRYVPFNEKPEKAYTKFAATHFGALIQLDTAEGYWLNGYSKLNLIISVDDATRTIVGAGIYLHDSTLNNMRVIKQIIQEHGIPALFYTDNDSKFKVIRHGDSHYHNYQDKTLAGETETQIRRALTEAGSALITHAPFHPQSKGKVEKLIRFIEDCFLKNHGADNLKQLNRDFKNWISWYDIRNHRTLGIAPKTMREKLIRENKVAFRPVPLNLDLNSIFALKDERKPNKYNIVSYQGKEYQLPQSKLIYPSRVELRITPDNRIKVFNQKHEQIAEFKHNPS